jgi:hypothetical protein
MSVINETQRANETTPFVEKGNSCNPPQYDNTIIVNFGDEDSHISSRSRWESSTWRKYNDLLEKRPILVKSITATIILGSADLFAQLIHQLGREEHSESSISKHGIDWLRATRYASIGLIGAPWSHYYFHYLDYYFPPTENPCTCVTATKVCIDQFIQAPILLATMIFALSLMNGLSFSGIRKSINDTYWDSLIANCKFSIIHGTIY